MSSFRHCPSLLRRGSASQISLHKILHTIVTLPPPPQSSVSKFSESLEHNYGFSAGNISRPRLAFDLNDYSPEGDSHSPQMSSSTVTVSVSLPAGIQKTVDQNAVYGGDSGAAEGSLALLIEAAELILGEPDESRGSNPRGRIVQSHREEAAPEIGREYPDSAATRMTRRRSRVLPSKYKDSVLEPLTPSKRSRR